jgi:hypothetical protein
MRGFWLTLTTKVRNFFQKISERRGIYQIEICEKCGNCDECSLTGICTIETEHQK